MNTSDAPLLERGRIKIYGRVHGDKSYYDVVDGRDKKNMYQASVEAGIGGSKLSPQQVYQMMAGNAVEIDAVGSSGPYKFFAFVRNIGKKANGRFINRFINLGRALPIYKKGTEELVGFRLRHPDAKQRDDDRTVSVFLKQGGDQNPIMLEDPKQAYKILHGEPVVIPGRGTLTLEKIEEKTVEGRVNYNARIDIDWEYSQEQGQGQAEGQGASDRFTFADDGDGEGEEEGEGEGESIPETEEVTGEEDDDPFAVTVGTSGGGQRRGTQH